MHSLTVGWIAGDACRRATHGAHPASPPTVSRRHEVHSAWGATVRGGEIQLDPTADDVDGVGLLLARELATLGDPVPALEACPAAGRGRVLGDEHGMATVRRLLAVLGGRRGSEPRGQELPGVRPHDLHATQLDRCGLTATQVELR